jgi:diguanylate cyclase (GGDEF)-like protein
MDHSESARLRALYGYSILDTPPEPNLDRITALAAIILDQPVCTLSLADADRHWFKSRYGLSDTEIPRRMSFCDETIRSDDVFVVPDAFADSRFAAAPIVAGPPHMRFYAGAPLVSPDGSRIGSLCVLDTKPHADFSDKQGNVLLDLAHTAVELLEARSRQIELAKLTEEIAHLARHDPLTGLANRRLLGEHMERTMTSPRPDEQTAVLYLDLDWFKEINDSLGHPAGDMLLRQVADRLRRTVRSTDRVARLGGDEFAIIQTCPDARGRAADLADRLIAAVSAPYDIEGHSVVVGASIGIAIGANAATPLDPLFEDADIALYCAKSAGGGRRVFFEAGMRRAANVPYRSGDSAPGAQARANWANWN